ncbi:MAG: cellulase family glycosylhydrolase [Bacteroidia bacterium]|nr:cellulase family glycosylhydrolase [Bacteroidia bacterium]
MKIFPINRLYSLAFFLLVPLVCSQQASQSSSKDNDSKNNGAPVENSAPVSTSEKTEEGKSNQTATGVLPKNWPWRGICFQSENSDESDIAYLAGIGVNFVRIQMKPSIRAKREKRDPKQCFYAELDWAEKMLDACKKHGLTSVLAFNHLVLDPESEVDDKSSEFWSQKKYADSTYSMVAIIASRFKNRGDELSAYEVIGEPAIQKKGGPEVPPGLEMFFRNVLTTIRKYDTGRWFLLTPGPWGKPTNYNGFRPFNIKDDKLIYGAHMYLPDGFIKQGLKGKEKGSKYPGVFKGEKWDKKMIENKFSALRKFEKDHGYLIYIGEFQATRWSPGADDWAKDVLQTIDSFGWSWSMFAYEAGTEAWDPFYDVADRSKSPKEWTIKYVGPTTPLWKYMITEYAKNKKQ